MEIVMNIDHAKAIPIAEILAKISIHPKRVNSDKLLYLSPRRKEKTPSFWVYTKTNRWHDYGDGKGGDSVDLVRDYLKYTREEHTVSDALRWIKNMGIAPYVFNTVKRDFEDKDQISLVLKTKKPIQHLGLIQYLEKRGISIQVARQHLKEIHVRNNNTNKSFFALGFPNEEGGFELRNPFFKGSLGQKAISFIRGNVPKPKSIHVFEGFMDYLSTVCQMDGTSFKGDVIVLNSLSNLKQIIPYIQNYGYQVAFSWLDNDKAGHTATETLADFCKTIAELKHAPMNKVYAPHKDVNAWHMHQKGLIL